MKKSGILNVQLSAAIAALGHKDLFLIGDCGMPIPPGVPIVDLVLVQGVPTFEQVVRAVMNEVKAEKITIAENMDVRNPKNRAVVDEVFAGVETEVIPHEELKKLSARCRFAVRTGENTPLANVIVQCGVAFG